VNVKITLENFNAAISDILSDFLKADFEKRQGALMAGAAVMVERLKAVSPNGPGNFAENWAIKEYNGEVYVYNTTRVASKGMRKADKDTRTVKKGARRAPRAVGGIPLSNILEYKTDQKHHGFISKAKTAAAPAVLNAIKNKINGGT
jgi:hypothetical protein